MSAELVVISTGALTAVGLSSEQVCTATRAGISSYQESGYLLQTAEWEPIIATTVPFHPRAAKAELLGRFVAMARLALEECLAGAGIKAAETALFLGVPETHRLDQLKKWFRKDLPALIEEKIVAGFHPASQVLPYGNVSVFYGLLKARELIQQGQVRWCVVGGVDSLVNPMDLDRLEHTWRLHREGESQGLVPGEGAAFIAVTTRAQASGSPALGIIAGIGIDKEEAGTAALGDGHPTGKGLERALKAAVRDAGIHESQVGLRVSDLNGERYGAFDSMLAVSRFYRTERNGLPIWHPAESVGEIGAAVGALLLLVACDGLARGYAPAASVMCETSSEGGLRGACLLRPIVPPPAVLAPRRPPRAQRPVLPFIVSQHAEEAAFLWLLREGAIHQPHFDLDDITDLDERLEAHIDGLRIAGGEGWEICQKALEQKEAGEAFAASVLAFESGDEGRIKTVLEVARADLQLSRGVVSSLGWLPYDQAEGHIRNLLSAGPPMVRRMGVAAATIHRRDPGRALTDALSDHDPFLQARALWAAGQLGRVDLLPILQNNLRAEYKICRFFAAWSSALLGDNSAIAVLKSFAASDGPYREEALKIALRRMDLSAALGWQKELTLNSDSLRLSVMGAGIIGDPALVSWLIEEMKIPVLARVAGESFTMITGIDISYEDLGGKRPEGFVASPTENPEDENVEMDPDEDLPWPDPELVLDWWNKNKGRFKNGTRYLLGQPMTTANLQQILRTGRQRQRAAAALELAMIKPGSPLFEVRAPGFRQKKTLGLK